MHTNSIPESCPLPEEDIFAVRSPITARGQVESDLLSLSEDELRQHIAKGERRMENFLTAIGMNIERLSPGLIVEWCKADPNMLVKLATAHFTKGEQNKFVAFLDGMLIEGDRQYLNDHDSYEHTRSRNPIEHQELRAELCAHVLSTPPPEDENKARAYRNLQKFAVAAQIEMDSAIGLESFKTLPSDDNYAERDVSRMLPRTVPRHILPPELRRSNLEGSLQYWMERQMESPDTLEQEFEKEAEKTKANDEYWRNLGHFRESDKSKRPPWGADPVKGLLVYSGGFIGTTRIKFPSPQLAIAMCRYLEKHPSAYEYSIAERLLNTASITTRENAPEELLQWIAIHVWKRPVAENDLDRKWEWLLHIPTEKKTTGMLREMLATNHDYSTLTKAMSGVFQGEAPEFYALEELPGLGNDPRVLSTAAEWIENHRQDIVSDREDLEDLSADLMIYLVERIRRDQDPATFGLDIERPTSESGSYIIDMNMERLRMEFAPLVVWILHGHHVPLATSYQWLAERGETMPKELFGGILRHPEYSAEAQWKLWDSCKDSPLESAKLITDHFALVMDACGKNAARFAQEVSMRILDPVIAGKVDTWQWRWLAEVFESVAKVDQREARSLLDSFLEHEGCRTLLKRMLESSAEVMASFAHLFYADIAFPEQKKSTNVRWESDNLQRPPAVAFAEKLESEGGVPWFARPIPCMDREAFIDRWLAIVRERELPPPLFGRNCDSREHGDDHAEKDYERMMEQLRDQLLENIDDPINDGHINPDMPNLPAAPMLSEKPRVVGTLSKPLTGDARYMLMKINRKFDPRYGAHLPLNSRECAHIRPQMNREVKEGEDVELTMHMADGAVVPHIPGAATGDIDLPKGVNMRWQGYWSKRIHTNVPVDVTIPYRVGPAPVAGDARLADVLARLPNDAIPAGDILANIEHLPPTLRMALEAIDIEHQPLAIAVEQIQALVHQWYEYEFILANPVYKEKYRAFLAKMPYRDPRRNAYLDFIHSLREEDEDVLGRGVCGQLTTVLMSAFRSRGIPADFGVGFLATQQTITTNDCHAWPVVPMLDERGQVFYKPVEATGGGSDGVQRILAEAPKSQPTPEEVATEDSHDQDPESSERNLRDQVEHWRTNLSGTLLGKEVSAHDIVVADLIIRQAERWRAHGILPTKEVLTQLRDDIANAGELPSHDENLGDAFSPEGIPLESGTRRILKTITAAIGDTLSPGTRDIIDTIRKNGSDRSRHFYREMRSDRINVDKEIERLRQEGQEGENT